MLNEQLNKDIELIKFLEEEKRARLENEVTKSAQLVVKIVEYVYNKTKDIESLTFILSSLNKKRNQSKNAVKEMVNYTLKNIFGQLNEDEKIKLLKTLIEISEGRIYVEFEYAEAVKSLTEIFLARNDKDEAARLIQDIQIETFGSIDKIYKVNYILFQMKILLSKGDYIRTLIVGNKINRKHLNDAGLEKQKIGFYRYMIQYYIQEKQFIDVSKSYKILYDFVKELEVKYRDLSVKNTLDEKETALLPTINEILQNRENNSQEYFENYIMFLSLCPPEQETRNMFKEVEKSYKHDLEANKLMQTLVKIRLSDDIIRVTPEFLNEFAHMRLFHSDPENTHKSLFRKYLIQHNLGIFQKYFSQVKLERISEMVAIEVNEVEHELADMCINKHIYAKINRINLTANFKPKQDAADKLNDMNFDLSKMLEVIETTCHLIDKENLKYDIK